MNSGAKIMFLIAEVKKGASREGVLETLSSQEVLNWLELCDHVILQEENNKIRKLFRDLSRAAEGMVTEVCGPSVKDVNASSSMLALARTITEQYDLLNIGMCSNLLVLYAYDTMKILTIIDQDCCLIITVLTMCSYKWSMFTTAEWRQLGHCSSFGVFWPMLGLNRK